MIVTFSFYVNMYTCDENLKQTSIEVITMYRFMSDEEITIRQISDLKMIHLYQLNGNDALAVYYSDNKQINLCTLDDHYNLLMKQILSLYAQCEDKDSIVIEDTAKKLLDKALACNTHHSAFFNRIGKQYANQEGTLCPRFTSDSIIRDTLLPMLRYYLQQLYQMWNSNIIFEEETIGWHRKCVLKAKTGNDTFIMPVRLTMLNANAYKISVGNFIHDFSNLEFEISYKEDQLHVFFENTKLELLGESCFKWDNQQLKAYTTIHLEKKIVYHQDEPIKQLTYTNEQLLVALHHKNYLLDLDTSFTYATIYQLPWNDFIIYRNYQTQDELVKRIDYDTIYINEYRTKLALRHYSYSLVENKSDGLKLRTNGSIMRKLYYGDKRNEIETLFLPVGYYSGWDYREYLENKYFYHSAEELQS